MVWKGGGSGWWRIKRRLSYDKYTDYYLVGGYS